MSYFAKIGILVSFSVSVAICLLHYYGNICLPLKRGKRREDSRCKGRTLTRRLSHGLSDEVTNDVYLAFPAVRRVKVIYTRHLQSSNTVVYKGYFLGKCVAVKTISGVGASRQHFQRTKWYTNARNEADACLTLGSKFIIRAYLTITTSTQISLLCKYCYYGNLEQLMAKCGKLREKDSRFVIGCLVLAVRYLHEHRLLHRDIKTANMFIRENGYILLGDLGNVRKVPRRGLIVGDSRVGTEGYRAPELLCDCGHGYEVDYWGIGVVVYETLTGVDPFYDESVYV